jgi:hypothetical protein
MVAHGVAAGSISVSMLPWAVRWVLMGLVAVSLLVSLRHQRRQPVTALILGRYGELEIETKVGARETVLIGPHTTVFPGLIVLLLRRGGRPLALPLLPDALDADAHRQLRLWLQWRAKAALSAAV